MSLTPSIMSYTKTAHNAILCEHYPGYPGKNTENLKAVNGRKGSFIYNYSPQVEKVVLVTGECSRLH